MEGRRNPYRRAGFSGHFGRLILYKCFLLFDVLSLHRLVFSGKKVKAFFLVGKTQFIRILFIFFFFLWGDDCRLKKKSHTFWPAACCRRDDFIRKTSPRIHRFLRPYITTLFFGGSAKKTTPGEEWRVLPGNI